MKNTVLWISLHSLMVKNNNNAFLNFSSEQRPKIKAENPKIKFGQIAKKIGLMWKEMSEEAKAKYKNPASGEKAE